MVKKLKEARAAESEVENLNLVKKLKEARAIESDVKGIPKKCKHFEQFSWCNKGENCPLLHPKQICLSFKRRGSCPDSSQCKDLHQTADCEY